MRCRRLLLQWRRRLQRPGSGDGGASAADVEDANDASDADARLGLLSDEDEQFLADCEAEAQEEGGDGDDDIDGDEGGCTSHDDCGGIGHGMCRRGRDGSSECLCRPGYSGDACGEEEDEDASLYYYRWDPEDEGWSECDEECAPGGTQSRAPPVCYEHPNHAQDDGSACEAAGEEAPAHERACNDDLPCGEDVADVEVSLDSGYEACTETTTAQAACEDTIAVEVAGALEADASRIAVVGLARASAERRRRLDDDDEEDDGLVATVRIKPGDEDKKTPVQLAEALDAQLQDKSSPLRDPKKNPMMGRFKHDSFVHRPVFTPQFRGPCASAASMAPAKALEACRGARGGWAWTCDHEELKEPSSRCGGGDKPSFFDHELNKCVPTCSFVKRDDDVSSKPEEEG